VFFGFGFEAIHQSGPFASSDTVLSRILNWFEVSVEELPIEEREYLLLRAPGFFNSEFEIYVEIPTGNRGDLIIYDLLGREIDKIAQLESGIYSISWDGRDNSGYKLSNGSYFIRLNTQNHSIHKRVIILR